MISRLYELQSSMTVKVDAMALFLIALVYTFLTSMNSF